MSVCRSCGAQIEWAVTTAGKRIPLDIDPSAEGNLEVTGVIKDTPVVRVGHGDRVSHFATCPDAKDWRR